jgi:SulP family sulfate permease
MIRKLLPFTDWFPFNGKQFKADVLAGITVALLLIPQSMAYANLAGLPYVYGLNAAFIPGLIGALFGRSFHLSTGPVAMTSILTASVLVTHATPGSPEYLQLALILALLIGLLRILVGLFKFTRLANLISYPVILGFTNGAALIIAFSQIEKVIGIYIHHKSGFMGTIAEAGEFLVRLNETHLITLIMALIAFILVFLLRRIKGVPAVLITMVLTIIISRFIHFESVFDGRVIGEIPKGLPNFGLAMNKQEILDILPLVVKLIPSAMAIVLIGFLEVLSVTKAISAQSGQRMNYDQEMVSQGMASIAAGFSSAYPVSGSLSRTALSYMSGAVTGFAQVVTSLMVLLVLLFMTPLLYHLPESVLAVAIIMAVRRLMKFRTMINFWNFSKREFFLSVLTFISTLIFAPSMTMGILIGVVFSLIFSLVMDRPGGFTEPMLQGEVLSLRIRRSMLFIQINQMEEQVLNRMALSEELKFLEIKGKSMQKVDLSGLEGFRNLCKKLETRKGALAFIDVSEQMKNYLKRLKCRNMLFFKKEEDFLYYLAQAR